MAAEPRIQESCWPALSRTREATAEGVAERRLGIRSKGRQSHSRYTAVDNEGADRQCSGVSTTQHKEKAATTLTGRHSVLVARRSKFTHLISCELSWDVRQDH